MALQPVQVITTMPAPISSTPTKYGAESLSPNSQALARGTITKVIAMNGYARLNATKRKRWIQDGRRRIQRERACRIQEDVLAEPASRRLDGETDLLKQQLPRRNREHANEDENQVQRSDAESHPFTLEYVQ